MPDRSETTPPADVTLLLRAHAEQRWLSREVIPVLRQIQTRSRLPEEQYAAALAYLEVIWIEALAHARESDAARRILDVPHASPAPLPTRARRYHEVVRALRTLVAARVRPLVALPDAAEPAPAPR